MSPRAKRSLARTLAVLAAHHGEPPRPIPRTPLAWILWENVAYLVNDERRARAFAALRKVARTAEGLRRARREALLEVTRLGGMHPEARVDRLLDIAELALELGGGELEGLLALPRAAARKALRRFPSIGAPGADRILLACGAGGSLALESNGLRVLLRLGYGTEGASYAATYKAVLAAVAQERGAEALDAWRAQALLRTHGRTLCRNRAPDCEACPLAAACPAAETVR